MCCCCLRLPGRAPGGAGDDGEVRQFRFRRPRPKDWQAQSFGRQPKDWQMHNLLAGECVCLFAHPSPLRRPRRTGRRRGGETTPFRRPRQTDWQVQSFGRQPKDWPVHQLWAGDCVCLFVPPSPREGPRRTGRQRGGETTPFSKAPAERLASAIFRTPAERLASAETLGR